MPKTISVTVDTQSPALAHWSDQAYASLRQVTITRVYQTGETIFEEGARSQYLWFIECGRVRLYTTASDGRELTVCIARAADRFCLDTYPLFEGQVSLVSAQALESVRLKLLDKRAIEQRIMADLNLGMAFAKMMAERYRHFTKLATALALHRTRVRVADALLCQAGLRGEQTALGIELDLDLTQEMFASCVGTDRAVVARALLQFEREGILQAKGKHVTLYNIGALEKMVYSAN